MISVGLIFASQTQHPNVYHREVFRVAKEDVAHLALNRAELPKKFCVLIRRIAVEEFMGCAASALYGSSPRVSVRVIDSSGDFNSDVCSIVSP